MHDPAVARPELDARDRHVVIQGERQGEGPVEVDLHPGASSTGSGIVRTRSGGPSAQPSENRGGGGKSAGSPSATARLGPSGEDLLLDGREARCVEEHAGTRMRLPGRHLAGRGHFADEVGPPRRIAISQQ